MIRFLIGLAFFSLSAYPLGLITREWFLGWRLESRYSVLESGLSSRVNGRNALRSRLGEQDVWLEDDQPVDPLGNRRATAPVRTLVNGRDYSVPAPVEIRLASQDANRYWGQVSLLRLMDRQQEAEQVAVVQRIDPTQYRILLVSEDGAVEEQRFSYEDRCSPPLRTLLIRPVTGHPTGYCSDILQGWPTLWFPLIFPVTTGAVGLIFLAWGAPSAFRFFRGRRVGVN